jgi:hypothetical protein
MRRRNFLKGMTAGLGAYSFNSMMATENGNPLSSKQPHHKPKAKACIMIFLEGGPSHIDTFDPKPALEKLHLKEYSFTKFGKKTNSFYVKSPFAFKQHGESGIPMAEHFKHLGSVADDLCMYRGCQADSVNHPTALSHMNTGNKFSGDPGLGAWINYGLGSENPDLPGHMVMTETYYPQGGANNWSNGYLPAQFQGTPLRASGSPILDLATPESVTAEHQRHNLDLMNTINKKHMAKHPEHAELAARMNNYELAFRMQGKVPGIIDIDKESEHTKKMYGIDSSGKDGFNRQCLLARRLVENGVRFIQVYSGGWDSHDYLERSHKARIQASDQGIAALIKDLKQRGMLEDTLVVCTGEFGRTSGNTKRGGGLALGRDHNAEAMSMFFAGGGTKAGHIIGATDEIGSKAVEVVRPIRDVHCTILDIMGLDDNKLTYFHGGRHKQMSQIGGSVIKELLV